MSQPDIPSPPGGPEGPAVGDSAPIASSDIAAATTARADQRLRRRHMVGELFSWACGIATWSSLLVLGFLLVVVLTYSWNRLSFGFLLRSGVTLQTAGLFPAIGGTLSLLVITAALAVPIGTAAAIYLEEYSRPTFFTRLIQLNISNLAGVPSVVYGILGYTVFVRMFGLKETTYAVSLGFANFQLTIPFGRTVIAGGLTLTLLSLPVIIIAAQEALRAVPQSIRHASYALGASRWQTIWFQVLPAAVPGILTGVILALSRAIGETAPLAVLGAVGYISYAPGRLENLSQLVAEPGRLASVPFDKFTAIPLQIYNWVSESREGFDEVAAAGIIVLLLVLLLLNGSAIIVRQRFQKNLRW